MRIQHNIMSMNAYRNYNNNTSALSKNLEKLSSGYRINRAGDDAAGLAISEKMRAQITGLNAAQKNVKDGISLVKTAEGAMQEIQDMLNRMDYLATQSANGTYQDEVDREALQQEVDSLREEINRIADSANFNGIKLLDGSLDAGKAAEVTAGTKVEWSDVAMNAVGKKTNDSKDGVTPSEATKASFTITFSASADFGASLAAYTSVGGKNITDIFDIVDENGDTVSNLNSYATSANVEAGSLTFTAKVAGAIDSAQWDDLLNMVEGKAKVDSVEGTNGTDVGGAGSTPATKAKFTFEFDFTKIKGGEKFVINGKTFVFDKTISVGDSGYTTPTGGDAYYQIGILGLDLENGKTGTNTAGSDWVALGQEIADAFKNPNDYQVVGNNTFELAIPTSSTVVASDIEEGKFTIKIRATDDIKGVAGNVDTAEFDDVNDALNIKAVYGQEEKVGTGVGNPVKVTYNVNLKSLGVGDTINVGGTKLEIIADKDEDGNANSNDTANGKITLATWKNALAEADGKGLHKLLKAAGYDEKTGNVTYKNSILSIEKTKADDTTAEAWSKGLGSLSVGKTVTISEEEAAAGNSEAGKAMNLQIGDSSDSFNQMKVSIGDMHTKAMGTQDEDGNTTTSIADINIGTSDGAQAAVNVIKDSINYVSSVRGQLGAYQNRLEHTQNNLSVMAENIQDAESAIRDTDVASEMMSYVKNNILVQSAQAMLAQANQVPQGVLQLLG